MTRFHFLKYPVFTDNEIDVAVQKEYPAKSKLSRFFNSHQSDVPRYQFKIALHGKPEKIGYVALKIAFSDNMVKYYGQISYEIQEPYRGHGYAAKACRLVKQVAIDHHMDVVWICVVPENIASRKTCERIGCTFVEMITLPPQDDFYKKGTHQVCRYRWILYP